MALRNGAFLSVICPQHRVGSHIEWGQVFILKRLAVTANEQAS